MRFLLLAWILGSCGSFQRMAMRSASPLFVEGSQKLTLERNWEFFRDSAPANLKFLEMIYLQDKRNLSLLSTLIKGYSGYAYAVPETLAYEDELLGVEGSIHRQNAIDYYTRAFDYGLDYLEHKGISRKDLMKKNEDDLKLMLEEELGKDDLTATLFLAQSWGSLINLQKDNVALVSFIPKVKSLFDWVCKIDPKIENGICEIFQAQYEASRPRMLGGSPEKAKVLYRTAMEKYPRHLLIRIGYIQYSLLPSFDQESYEKEAVYLREEFKKWEDLNRDILTNSSEYRSVEHLNLYNAIAQKRFKIIEKNKNKIF